MSKTFYFLIWSNQTFNDFVNEIEYNKGYTDVVIFGPEEHDAGKLFYSHEQYILFKRFLDYHNINLKIVLGSPNDLIANPRYVFKDLPDLTPWSTYFANFVMCYNMHLGIRPYGHNNTITKHFTSLNGRAHPWRCMFADHMYKYDLYKNGYVSWHNAENWNYDDMYQFKWWTPENINFDKVWIENTTGIKDIYNPPMDQFRDSLFSVISESTMECIFVTEKTYVPIYHKRPFLIFGAPGIHKYLKSLGFKLFEEIIDYSFDSIDDDEERCDALMQQLLKISRNNIQKTKRMLQPKIEYNFLNMLRLVSNSKNVSRDVRRILKHSDQDVLESYKDILNIGSNPKFINFLIENNIDLTKKD
jgi:hypothetical protein